MRLIPGMKVRVLKTEPQLGQAPSDRSSSAPAPGNS
jgi:hypothetical protein